MGVKVVLTVASLDATYGGPLAKVLALAEGLSKWDCCSVVLLGSRAGDIATRSGVVALEHRWSYHGTPIPSTFQPISDAVVQADIVHVMGLRDPIGAYAALTARRNGIPYIIEPCGMLTRRLRSHGIKWFYDLVLGRMMLRDAARVIATSSSEVEDFRRAGIASERIALRINGVQLDSFADPLERHHNRVNPPRGAEVRIVTIARIAQIKGLEFFLRVIARVEHCHWVIAGPDEGDGTLERFERAIDQLGLNDRVRVVATGVWGSQKEDLIRTADFFCLPSAYESFGTAAAEAACLGIPVILSDGCGVRDLLPGSSTIIIPFGDVFASQGYLEAAIDNLPTLSREAKLNVTSAAHKFTWSGLAKQQLAVYARVLRERSAEPDPSDC